MQDITVNPTMQHGERACRVVSRIHKRTGLVMSMDTVVRKDRDSTMDSPRIIMEHITKQVQEEKRRPLDLLVTGRTIQEDLGGRCGSEDPFPRTIISICLAFPQCNARIVHAESRSLLVQIIIRRSSYACRPPCMIGEMAKPLCIVNKRGWLCSRIRCPAGPTLLYFMRLTASSFHIPNSLATPCACCATPQARTHLVSIYCIDKSDGRPMLPSPNIIQSIPPLFPHSRLQLPSM